MSLAKFFKALTKRNRWVSLLLTRDAGEYYRTKGILNNQAIPSKTHIGGHGFNERTAGWSVDRQRDYELFVRESDLHRANNLLHNH